MVDVTGYLTADRGDIEAWVRDRDFSVVGTVPSDLSRVRPIGEAESADVSFCRFEGENGLALVRSSRAGLLFVPESLVTEIESSETCLIACTTPRLALLHFLREFWHEPNLEFDPASNPCIHPDARIAEGARIGPFTVIGADVTIGAGTRIGSNCHIEHAEIGAHVQIANSVTIGGAGYGYEDDSESGEVILFPHTGGVSIADGVEIGSSTCIDRGSVGDTVIGEDCKIDNLVHVAHNVRMGRRCKVIALAIIGGSVKIGDDAWIAPAAAVRDWRQVGANAVVGLGAVVTRDVPAETTVVGNPAKPIATSKDRYKS